MEQIAAFSGGKDSTAMVLKMAEEGEEFSCLFTPAGNEPPEVFDHVDRIIQMIQRPLILPENRDLLFWIEEFQALPSWRMPHHRPDDSRHEHMDGQHTPVAGPDHQRRAPQAVHDGILCA